MSSARERVGLWPSDGVAVLVGWAPLHARSRKYRALKQTLRSDYGNVQGKQRALEDLVAAGAATWPQADDIGDAASAQSRFLGCINEVIALEERLEDASERGDVASVEALLASSPLAIYVSVDEAACQASRNGHEVVVARLILAGADVHYGYYDMHGGTYVGPLLEACEAGHVAVVAVLVAAGANVNMLNGAPLQIACKFGHLTLLDWLLEHGADVHIDEDEALRTAAEYGQAHAIARLLAAGATINIGRGPVRAAVNSGEDIDRIAIVRQLVDAGADLTMVDDDISLALAAGHFGSLPLVELLLQAGANVHTDNDEALVVACRNGRVAVVKRLLDAGADVACVDWTEIPAQDRTRIVLRVRTEETGALPRWMRLVRSLHLVRVRRPLHQTLQRARDRLDSPPSSTLGTDAPTRDQLIAHLQTAGRRFAREYWTEGLPLFFPQYDLGPVPDEFVY